MNNLVIDLQELMQQNITGNATVSTKRGLVYLKIYLGGTDNETFATYLKDLSKKMNNKKFFLFMDNLGSHRNQDNRKLMERLGITPIFNVSYSPEFNPIEGTFADVKRVFCKERTNQLV